MISTQKLLSWHDRLKRCTTTLVLRSKLRPRSIWSSTAFRTQIPTGGPSHHIPCIRTHNKCRFIVMGMCVTYAPSDDAGCLSLSATQLHGCQARPHGLHGTHQIRYLGKGVWIWGWGLRRFSGKMIIFVHFERSDEIFDLHYMTRTSWAEAKEQSV